MNTNEIYASTLFQFQNDAFVQDYHNPIIIFGQYYGYFINQHSLCFIDIRYKSSQSSIILQGICSIFLYDIDDEILIILSDRGIVSLLKCKGNEIEFLNEIFNIDSINSVEDDIEYMYRSMLYDISKQLMLIQSNNGLSIYTIFYNDSDDLTIDFIISIQRNINYYELWSEKEYKCLLILSDASSIIYTLALFRDELFKWSYTVCDLETNNPCFEEVNTKHISWITTLSRHSHIDNNSHDANIVAIGDCIGTISFWIFNVHETNNEITKKTKSNFKYLMRNKAIFNRNGISDILHELCSNIWWVGDDSGAITGAHLNKHNKELHPYRRILLFGTIGRPSQLQWIPQQDQYLNVKTGILRAFSTNCGMLVECKITSNIESVFRVWPGSIHTPAPAPLSSDHGSRAITSDSVHVFNHAVVESCAILHNLNIIVTIGTSSRYIHFTNIDSGVIQYTILLEESYCKTIAAYDMPCKLYAYIAVGFANGKFILIKLNRLMEFDVISHNENHIHLESEIELKKRNSLKAEAIINFDILGAVTTDGSMKDNLDTNDNNNINNTSISNNNIIDILEDKDDISEGSDPSHSAPIIVTTSQVRHKNGETSLWTTEEEAEIVTNLTNNTSQSLHNSYIFPTKKRRMNHDLFDHDVEYRSQFCPLPITDIIFSLKSEYIAICYLRKIIIVFKNTPDDNRKEIMRIKFEHMFCDIQCLQPNPIESQSSPSLIQQQDDDEDCLKLLLQSMTTIKILDAIKGILLNEIDLYPTSVINEPIMRCSAWSILLHNKQQQQEQKEGILGFFVGNDMKVFFFNEDEDKAFRSKIFDSPNHISTHSSTLLSSKVLNTDRLDSLMKGVTIQDLKAFSPLACIWSFRRLLLLRIQCSANVQTNMKILRSEEFILSSINERIIYSTSLKIKSNHQRKHRAIVVLSSGHVFIMHI